MQSLYTNTQKQNVIDLIKRGDLTARQIAETTGTDKHYVYNIKTRYVKTGKPTLVPATTTPEILEIRTPEKHHPFPFDEAAVIALYKAGFNRQKIVKSLHVPDPRVKDAIKKYRAEHPEFETPKVFARLERDKRICELRKAGNSYAKIAEKVGMSEGGVCAVCSKYGLTHAAKRARKDNGEIPQEILAPLVEYMRKFISAEFAEKVQELAKNIA